MLKEFTHQGCGESGFTLIELMIVVAIVAILASVSIPAYFNHLSRSRQSNAINELMQIRAAQEMYFAENGGFAGNIGLLRFYTGAGTAPGAYYSDRYYRYELIDSADADTQIDTIQALGDLNMDGTPSDKWHLTIDDPAAKPRSLGSNEGFGWSSLGALFQ
ncbi:MAG: prepilin-type N-terminal cleavage/methylation domain-containing protein [Desulfobulbales bacterium]|nr:prepilin-type N-terminal cleavage/methylation domain-containing protein [Desulfobulbales bacterium]